MSLHKNKVEPCSLNNNKSLKKRTENGEKRRPKIKKI